MSNKPQPGSQGHLPSSEEPVGKPRQLFISLLRGINVSGQKALRMAELKEMYESLGYERVITYVQSGNVVFQSLENDRKLVAGRIEAAIQARFGYKVPVIIRDDADLKRILEDNPYLQRTGVSTERLYVTFLYSPVDPALFEKLEFNARGEDECQLSGLEIYMRCPGGYGRTTLSNNFFESKLGQIATTRNWKTVVKLAELAASQNY